MHTSPDPTRFSQASGRMLAWAIGLVLMLGVGASAAQETLIVLSSQAKPYVLAAKSCEESLEQSGIAFTRVELASLTAEDIESITGDVIAIGGRAAATLGKSLPASTNLYYTMTPHPDQIGLTKRKNTSGISTNTDQRRQVDLIREGVPKARRIGALYRSTSASSVSIIAEMRSALPVGWELIAVDLDQSSSESKGIKNLLKQKIDIVWTAPDPSTYNHSMIKALLLDSIRKKVPVFGFSRSLVEAGATFGIGINPAEQGSQAAALVIAHASNEHHHANPEIAINLIAAKRIGTKLAEGFIRKGDAIFR